jgi:hypothetical protein
LQVLINICADSKKAQIIKQALNQRVGDIILFTLKGKFS